MEIFASDVIKIMNKWAPPFLAEKWDHSGLQVGNTEQPIKKILISLDVNRRNVSYAVNHKIDMIISHHPFLFKPIQDIDLSTTKGRIIEQLLTHKIVSFAAHTNLDTADLGVNDALAEKLHLQNCLGLVSVHTEKMYKISAYAKIMTTKVLEKELKERLGNQVSQFYLLDDEDDFTENSRLEFTVTESKLDEAKSILQQESENISYDIYILKNLGHQSKMGRIGDLPKEMDGQEALLYIKSKLGISCLKYSGNVDKKIKKIAILGGAGIDFSDLAESAGADLYLTGDVKYHEAEDASSSGFLIADGGHFYTERVIIPYLAKRLRKEFEKRSWKIIVEEDNFSQDVFSYI